MQKHVLILNGVVIMSEEFPEHINNSNHTAFLSRALVKKFDEYDYEVVEFVRSGTRFFSASIKLFVEVKPMETKVGDNTLSYKVEDV